MNSLQACSDGYFYVRKRVAFFFRTSAWDKVAHDVISYRDNLEKARECFASRVRRPEADLVKKAEGNFF